MGAVWNFIIILRNYFKELIYIYTTIIQPFTPVLKDQFHLKNFK